MIRKAEAPWLNREQRRHPKKLMRQIQNSRGGNTAGSNWLLAGLLSRIGIGTNLNGAVV